MRLIAAIVVSALFVEGCFSFNLGGKNGKTDTAKTEEVLVANPFNVYRTSKDVVLEVLVQDKDGKWVKSERRVMIPAMWYIGSGLE